GARAIDLPLFAFEERNLLAELAHARQIEAKVRLDRLLAEHEPRQGTPDELHHSGSEAGVENGDPEQEAGELHAKGRKVHRQGNAPKNDRKRRKISRGGHRRDGVVVYAGVHIGPAPASPADEAANVFGNALVRVVSAPPAESELVMHRVQEPAGG